MSRSAHNLADVRINYLNKALELFNTSMVVPVYFCYFTSATMVTSFILYKGLKAPAIDLITMVLGFLVTCFGITLLQMSKVDPKKFEGLDRRTTMLLQASRHETEAGEKGDVAALEEPGMDSLRGGFGAVGSIIRARSMSRRMSMRSDSMTTATGFGTSQHSTEGLASLQRYRLSDNPMPDDDHENIAMSPQNTGRARASTLKFGPTDTVHQYAYTPHKGEHSSDAFHSLRPHDALRQSSSQGSFGNLRPVLEGISPMEKDGNPYADPYLSPLSPESKQSISPISPESRPHFPFPRAPETPDHKHHQPERKTSFGQLFRGIAGGNTDDMEHIRGRTGSSGGSGGSGARSMRDYPKAKGGENAEREERTALVTEPDEMVRSEAESGESELGSPLRPMVRADLPGAGVDGGGVEGVPESGLEGSRWGGLGRMGPGSGGMGEVDVAEGGSLGPGVGGNGNGNGGARRPMGPRTNTSGTAGDIGGRPMGPR